MARAIVSVLILIVSLWAVRAYRQGHIASRTSAEIEVADSAREEKSSRGPASIPQPHVVGMEKPLEREVSAEVSKPYQRQPASIEDVDPRVTVSLADLGQAFPTRTFSSEDVRSMQREADRAEKEGLIGAADRASYIRSLAQLRVEQMDSESEMIPDDMYNISPDGDGFIEELPE